MASGLAASQAPNVPNYTVLSKLGSGTYATVYKAMRQSGAREVVAIKCVSKQQLTAVSKENLLQEIELLKSLQHEHIVSLIDFVWDKQHIHIIMEYCSGGDLLRFIKQRRSLPEIVCRRFLQQLALALHYLHERSVVHMDLKPQNILLTGGQCPALKIADFGFAHHLSTERHADQLRGSLLYMAPEIITDRRYSPKCDLWSVGIILYECLFGTAPFASDSYDDLYAKILNDIPVKLPAGADAKLSRSCCDLLTRLLQRDPQLRIEHRDFFQHKFIDLQHAPSPACLPTAKRLAMQAVAMDTKGDVVQAFHLYKQALDFLVPALHYEADQRKKQALREKICEYMSRAEYLQCEITRSAAKSQPQKPEAAAAAATLAATAAGTSAASAAAADAAAATASSKKCLSTERFDRLTELCNDHAQLADCLKQVKSFYSKMSLQQYEEALSSFENNCQLLLELIKEQADGERKTLLYELADCYLSQAEHVRNYLSSRNTDKQKQQLADIERGEAEAQKMCCMM